MANEKRLIDYDKMYLSVMAAALSSCDEDTIFDIMDASVVDDVPVVRCRECKYWGDEEGKLQCSDGALLARCKVHNYLIDGRHTGWCPTENDFCSCGERKDGDGNV